MGVRGQLIVGFFPEFVFQFSVVQVLVGLQKQFVNNFVFPTGPVLLLLIIIITILAFLRERCIYVMASPLTVFYLSMRYTVRSITSGLPYLLS